MKKLFFIFMIFVVPHSSICQTLQNRLENFYADFMKLKGLGKPKCEIEKIKRTPFFKKHEIYRLYTVGDHGGVGVVVSPSLLEPLRIFNLTDFRSGDFSDFADEEKINLSSKKSALEYLIFYLTEIFPEDRGSLRILNSSKELIDIIDESIDSYDRSGNSKAMVEKKISERATLIVPPVVDEREGRYFITLYAWNGGVDGKLLKYEILLNKAGFIFEINDLIVAPKWGSWKFE